VIFHDYYAEIADGDVERFVAAQDLGRLVTVGDDGPHIGLYPFTYGPDRIEIHLCAPTSRWSTSARGRAASSRSTRCSV